MATSVIGLDIGTTRVRAVEMQRGRGMPSLLRYAEVPLPVGAVRDGEVSEQVPVVHALRMLWADGKFSHRDVIMAVGNQRVLVRSLELPWMPMDQIRASLSFQVADTLPVAVEEALLDYYPTADSQGPNGRTLQGLLVAATRDTVQANIGAAESAGLRPLVVDLLAFGLLRATVVGEKLAEAVAIVDVGARVTTVVIVDGGVPRLVRTLPAGGHNVTEAVSSMLRVPLPEAELIKRQIGVGYAVSPELADAAEAMQQVTRVLVESIRSTLVYYAGNNLGRAVESVVLTGGGSYLPGFGQYLASACRMPVSFGNPLAGVTVAKTARLDVVRGVESTLAVPLGLALGVAA